MRAATITTPAGHTGALLAGELRETESVSKGWGVKGKLLFR